MKVYIVSITGNDYNIIHKVFATKTKAEEYTTSKKFKEVFTTICEKEVVE